jgi:hypothetical protein
MLLTLTAQGRNGTPPYGFLWTLPDGSPEATGSQLTHNFTNIGPGQAVNVTVTDSTGATASAKYYLPIPVQPFRRCPPTPPSNLTILGFSGTDGSAFLVGIAALIGLATAMVVLRRRKGRPPHFLP